jgi:hypothetical protein
VKETTVHLSEAEYAWVKSKGNNYLRHLIQLMMKLDVFLIGERVDVNVVIDEKTTELNRPFSTSYERSFMGEVGPYPIDEKGAGQ